MEIAKYSYKHYKDLTKEELYTLLYIRAQIFVLEQHCIYNDLDNIDQESWHLIIYNDLDEIIGLSRIIPPGKLYKEAAIGRVALLFNYRHLGLGRKMMELAISLCEKTTNHAPIRIMAQQYLQGFYESFGFIPEGDPFLDYDIVHIYMVKR